MRPDRQRWSAGFVGLLVIVGLGWLAGTASNAAAAVPVLPAGFSLHAIPTGQAANDLTGFVELPDGGAITIGKCGKVTFVPTTGAPRTLITVPAACVQDIGLIGIALPPDFASTRQVYTFYSANGG